MLKISGKLHTLSNPNPNLTLTYSTLTLIVIFLEKGTRVEKGTFRVDE